MQAERQLAAIEAASVPHMNRDGMRDVFDKYRRMIGHDDAKPAKPTLAELAAIGITVEHVTAAAGTSRDETEGQA